MIQSAPTAAAVHACIEVLAIAIGAALCGKARKRAGAEAMSSPRAFPIFAGLLLGAAIGNKLAWFIDRPDLLMAMLEGAAIRPGQSIIGGLLGGLVGVEVAKALTRQPQSTGDLMVWPIAIGISIGRVGCFLAGLHDDTYGLATSLPWGVDFGDGIHRHPTQLYDIAAVLALAAAANTFGSARVPGLRFKIFLAGYLAWRLAIDGLKPVFAPFPFSLSGLQWLCAFALAAYLPIVFRAFAQAQRALPRLT